MNAQRSPLGNRRRAPVYHRHGRGTSAVGCREIAFCNANADDLLGYRDDRTWKASSVASVLRLG